MAGEDFWDASPDLFPCFEEKGFIRLFLFFSSFYSKILISIPDTF